MFLRTVLFVVLLVGLCIATSPMYKSQHSLDFEVIRNKESIPHNGASTIRLYIKLKPTFINDNTPTTPSCVNNVYSPPSFSLWDWIFTNNALLLGTSDLFTYFGLKEQEYASPGCHYIPPISSLSNVKVKIQLLHQLSALTRASQSGVNNLKPFFTTIETEYDHVMRLTSYTLSVTRITAEGHVIVDITVPASYLRSVDVAKVSITCDNANTTEREDLITIRRNASTMDSTILPFALQYGQNASAIPMSQEQQVSVEYQLQRMASNQTVDKMVLSFEKHNTHTVYATTFSRIGNYISVQISPWAVDSVKKVGFRFKVPKTLQSGTQVLMKNVKLSYSLKKQLFTYPMEIELLEKSIVRQ